MRTAALILLLAVATPAIAKPAPPSAALTEAGTGLETLAREGADASVLVGIPTPAQRERALSEARATLTKLDTSRALLERRAAVLRARSGNEAEQRELAEITDGELGLRWPLLRARALLLIAAAGPAADGGKPAQEAAALLARIEPGWTAGESLRRVTLALAFRWADKSRYPGAPTAFDLLAGVAELPVGDDPTRTVPVALSIEAHAALAILRTAGNERLDDIIASFRNAAATGAFSQAVRTDPLTALFVDEVDARLRLRLDQPGAVRDAASIHAGLAALLSRIDPGARGEQAALQRLVCDKIAAAVESVGADPLKLPPLAAFAVARSMTDDPSRRSAGVELLLTLARREDPGPLGPESLWIAASSLASRTPAEQRSLVSLLLELAHRFPSSNRAPAALASALDLTTALNATSAAPADTAQNADLRQRALELALERQPPVANPDPLRLELATLVLGSSAPSLATLRRAFQLVEPIDPTSLARIAADDALLDAFNSAPSAPTERLDRAKLALNWARRARPLLVPGYELDLLDALLADPAGLAEARALAADINARSGSWALSVRYRGIAAQAELDRAAGDQAGALALLRAFAESVDRPAANSPGTAPRPAEFWDAWAEILTLIESATDAAEVRLRVRQLKLIDPVLGSGPAAQRLLALEARANK